MAATLRELAAAYCARATASDTSPRATEKSAAATPTSRRVKPLLLICAPVLMVRTVPGMRNAAAVMSLRRGSVLIVTVLLALVAAGVALVALRAAWSVEASENGRTDALRIIREARSSHARIQADLTVDPLLMFKQVLTAEAPRWCAEVDAVFVPGSAWPDGCGLSWSYREEDVLTDALSSPVLLLPPGSADRDMRLVTLIRLPQGVSAVETRYRLGSLRPFIHSDGDLDVSGAGWLKLSGLITSGGSVSLSGDQGLYGFGIIAAGPVVLHGSSPEPDISLSGAPALQAVGGVLAGGVRATFSQVRQQACRSLCIVESSSASPGDFVVPDGTRSIRLGVGGDRLTVHASPQAFDDALLLSPDAASVLVANGFWGDLIGEVEIPARGIVATDLDLLLTACSGGGQTCGQYSRSFTVMAGSPSRPAVAVLSGPLSGQGGARGGLALEGSLLLSTWNSQGPAKGISDMSVAVIGAPTGALPLIGPGPGEMRLRGTFVFDRPVSLGPSGSGLIYDAEAARVPPPFWPGPDLSPIIRSSRVVAPEETSSVFLSALLGGAG